jgi:hypothetical protein
MPKQGRRPARLRGQRRGGNGEDDDEAQGGQGEALGQGREDDLGGGQPEDERARPGEARADAEPVQQDAKGPHRGASRRRANERGGEPPRVLDARKAQDLAHGRAERVEQQHDQRVDVSAQVRTLRAGEIDGQEPEVGVEELVEVVEEVRSPAIEEDGEGRVGDEGSKPEGEGLALEPPWPSSLTHPRRILAPCGRPDRSAGRLSLVAMGAATGSARPLPQAARRNGE